MGLDKEQYTKGARAFLGAVAAEGDTAPQLLMKWTECMLPFRLSFYMDVHCSTITRWRTTGSVPSPENAAKIEEMTGGIIKAEAWL